MEEKSVHFQSTDASDDKPKFLVVPPRPEEWIASGSDELIWEDVQAFANLEQGISHLSGQKPSLHYGFPCQVKHIQKSRNEWSGQTIKPLFLFKIEATGLENERRFIYKNDPPQINISLLEELIKNSDDSKEIISSINEVLHTESDFKAKWKNALQFIDEISPFLKPDNAGEPTLETSNLPQLGKGNFSDAENMFAAGIVFFDETQGSASQYTRGLSNELNALKNESPNKIWKSVISKQENNSTQQNGTSDQLKEIDLMQVTHLNLEQRNCVLSAFNKPITVVTGPPGTGKSEIVINIIVNALNQNMSVLFGSKNHKAIDVVVERLTRILDKSILLRYGTKAEDETKFGEKLLEAVDNAKTIGKSNLLAELESYKESISHLKKKLAGCKAIIESSIERRNNIRQLDTAIEDLSVKLGSKHSFDTTHQIAFKSDHQIYHKKLSQLLKKYDKRSKSKWFKTFSLYRNKWLLRKILSNAHLLTGFIKIGTEENSYSYYSSKLDLKFARQLNNEIPILHDIATKQNALFELKAENEAVPLIEDIDKEMFSIEKEMIENNQGYARLKMEERLLNLTAEERNEISKYVSTASHLKDTSDREARALKNKLFNSVRKVFPGIAVTNLSVKNAIPLDSEAMDIVVIDEASQCDIPSSLPMIHRAKHAVIIGDPLQLRHISNINSKTDIDLHLDAGLSRQDDFEFLYASNSCFDLFKSQVGTVADFIMLTKHYRSNSNIINFSNENFYSKKLEIRTNHKKLHNLGRPGITWHNVSGQVVRPSGGSAYNLEEARAVVEQLKLIINISIEKGIIPSVGIVSPFRQQVLKIDDEIEKTVESYQRDQLDLTVNTIHKYQGDEKDIIIFSTVISNAMKKTGKTFLSNANLFNVAITRARSELRIVGDRQACIDSNISHLKKLGEYKNYVQSSQSRDPNSTVFESIWEKKFYLKLKEAGIHTQPQHPFEQYRLDLAIVDLKVVPIPLDIEIDGEKWHRDIDGQLLAKDLERDRYLRLCGWEVMRFWVYELRYDMDGCVKRVQKQLKAQSI